MDATWASWLPSFGLVFARCAGLVCLAPPMLWRHFPPSLRLAVAAVLAVPLALALPPVAATATAMPWGIYLTYLLQEAAVGVLLGLGLALLLAAAAAAGVLSEIVVLGEAEEEGPLATLLVLLVVLLFVQLNGLHWLVAYLRDSFRLLPSGGAWHTIGEFRPGLYWPARMFANLLAVAAPLVAAGALASLMLASIQRCLSGLQVAPLLGAVRYLAGLMALVVVVPLLGAFVLGQMNAVAAEAAGLLLQLARR